MLLHAAWEKHRQSFDIFVKASSVKLCVIFKTVGPRRWVKKKEKRKRSGRRKETHSLCAFAGCGAAPLLPSRPHACPPHSPGLNIPPMEPAARVVRFADDAPAPATPFPAGGKEGRAGRSSHTCALQGPLHAQRARVKDWGQTARKKAHPSPHSCTHISRRRRGLRRRRARVPRSPGPGARHGGGGGRDQGAWRVWIEMMKAGRLDVFNKKSATHNPTQNTHSRPSPASSSGPKPPP